MPIANLEEARQVLLSLSTYTEIRSGYWSRIYDAVFEYLTGSGNISTFRSAMRRAIEDAYADTAIEAWQDGGADLPLEDDALSWLAFRQSEELAYSETLALQQRLLKKEGVDRLAAIGEATARADGYAATLDGVYANIKVMALGNQMLTFGGEDGLESCHDCQTYKGKRHRAKWWIAHNAVPPNRDFECKGYRCEHYLHDDQGQLVTI